MENSHPATAETAGPCIPAAPILSTAEVQVPEYLSRTYWWAYLHPRAVWLFERQWLVNLILWGNFGTLRDAALEQIDRSQGRRILQVACVYGDFTPRLAHQLDRDSVLELVDVAPIQLSNARRKLASQSNVFLHRQDSADLRFADGAFDEVIVFFLLHEQPAEVRAKTIKEALRVIRPGGKAVFVDYHLPNRWNPLRYVMTPILKLLEPFALDLWQQEIMHWAPSGFRPRSIRKRTFFGGLYQMLVLRT